MTSIKLTICIPTYNQPAQLFRLLDIISSEINQFMLEGKVEVKIRDNSENNSTYELFMASKYIDKSWIDYKKKFNKYWVGFEHIKFISRIEKRLRVVCRWR